jgi:hypothetical protein
MGRSPIEIVVFLVFLAGVLVVYLRAGDWRDDLGAARRLRALAGEVLPRDDDGTISWIRTADAAYVAVTRSRILGPMLWVPLVFVPPIVAVGVLINVVLPERTATERVLAIVVSVALVLITRLVWGALLVRIGRVRRQNRNINDD